jgi:arylsulfatase A-like enzyme
MTANAAARPNVVLILADDLGFSDIGCYGGEIDTPNLDRLAADGHRISRFYNTARCSPSRASLLTGLHPHQTGIGILTQDDGPTGYPGTLNDRCATMAEILNDDGYRTHLSGKWHLVRDRQTPNAGWPTRRGFQSFFGTLTGCGSYFDPGTLKRGEKDADDASEPDFYYTDAIGEDAASFIRNDRTTSPFFLYVAFTAPHWPLHAKGSDLQRYHGRYDQGYDALRQQRLDRQRQIGVVDPKTTLSPRDDVVPPWDDVPDPAWQAQRMEAYAAQVDCMDQNIGKVLAALDETGQRDNTIVIFMADNGASQEELATEEAHWFTKRTDIFPGTSRDGEPIAFGNDPTITPGTETTYASYGRGWANLSNTPFRLYKEWVHEGGIATPFIFRWPSGQLDTGAISAAPVQLVDLLPTVLDAVGVSYPASRQGRDLLPGQGSSFLPTLRGQAHEPKPLYWEHVGNAAVRDGRWKLVRQAGLPWELYDITTDATELHNVAAEHAHVVQTLSQAWQAWADASGVKDWSHIVDAYRQRGLPEMVAKGS